MQMKLILDLSEKESLQIIDFLREYLIEHELDLELSGFNSKENPSLNQAFYAFYYANKYGVGLEFAQRLLNAYHHEDKDISNIKVLADLYEEIDCCGHDIIDALMEGDYVDMHNYLQTRYHNEGLDQPINAYFYQGEEKKLINDPQTIIDCISNGKCLLN